MLPLPSVPPTMNTLPPCRAAAAWDLRAVGSAPTNENCWLAKLNCSKSASTVGELVLPDIPPDSSTELLGSAVAGCPVLAIIMGDERSVQVFATGSYNSAEARMTPPVLVPPVTRTYPPLLPLVFGSHVAVCPERGTFIGATTLKVPVEP